MPHPAEAVNVKQSERPQLTVPVLVVLVVLVLYGTFTFIDAFGPVMHYVRDGEPWAVALFLMLLTTFVALVPVGVHSARRVARRTAAMNRWATAHGWSHEHRSSLLSSRFATRPLRGGAAFDVLRHTDHRGTVVSFTKATRASGDFGGDAGSGCHHVVLVTGRRRLPMLSLRPMTGRDRAERALGGQDVAVESEDFNERWRVECADERFAHEVVHPRLMARLEELAIPELALVVEGRDVAIYAPGRTALHRVEKMASVVLDIADLLPAYLASDFPAPGPDATRRDYRSAPERRRPGS